jgi:hypothetical protein
MKRNFHSRYLLLSDQYKIGPLVIGSGGSHISVIDTWRLDPYGNRSEVSH